MIRKLCLISLLALITISPAAWQTWRVEDALQPVEIQTIAGWQLLETGGLQDFTFGQAGHCILQSNNSIRITDCDSPEAAPKWQSADTWQVKEAITADLNRDGQNELVLVVWRPFKPWPIDTFMPHGGRISNFHDRNNLSCHLILVGWDGKVYRELWAGSALIDPVFNIQAVDLDGDGSQELAALEGQYDTLNQGGSLTIWDWNGFGFRLRDRVLGYFSDFGIVMLGQDVMIVTDLNQEEK